MHRFTLSGILIIMLASLLLLVSTIVYAHHPDKVTVVITDNGFFPNFISVGLGTNVTWINNGSVLHWPASDIHPTHKMYPNSGIEKCSTADEKLIFDACRGLKRDEAYSFTFNESGKWGAHDHLYPGNTMVVTVGATADNNFNLIDLLKRIFSWVGFFLKADSQLPSAESFRSSEYAEQKQIIEKLSKEDPGKSWQYLKDAFTVNSQITENPHELAHVVGKWIYDKKGIEGIRICDSTFAFGCYHGVIEKMLLELGKSSLSKIENTCIELFRDRFGLSASCVHGTGHGLLTWEGLNVGKALRDCDILNPQNRLYCYDGVFMEYSFSAPAVKKEDGWQLCASLNETYHSVCAKYHVYSFGKSINWNLTGMVKSCDEAPTHQLRNSCFSGFGFFVGNVAQGDLNKIKTFCALSQSEDGKYMCITSAAVEIIFQEYSNWWSVSSELCNGLPGPWKTGCSTETNSTITAYKKQIKSEQPDEIRQIKTKNSLDEQAKLYRKLIERVGPEEAQEYLYHSGMPFTGQTHLLNHVVGDYLYENYGASGLVKCKEYFLASCYHGFILHAIGADGLEGMDEIMGECRRFGITVTAQCSHALGHGFLTWSGYKNLTKALELCEEMSSRVDGFFGFNCRDGVFMENIWGVHSGEPSKDRWINANDSFYPCNDKRINPDYLDGCWSNQPSLMYQMFQGNITKVGEECLKVENSTHQQTCFNGLSRQIHPFTKGNVDSTFQLCSLLPEGWSNYCITTVSISDFSVGGRDLSFKICATISETGRQGCYQSLYGVMSIYNRTTEEYTNWCQKILEEKWRTECIRKVS